MRLRAALALTASLACGAPRAEPDAQVARDAAPLVAEPAPPSLLPCAPGWREVERGGSPACDPFPETGRAACSGDQAHLPGTPRCASIDVACPADGWPAGLPTDRPIVYVDDDAPAGGDGTTPARARRTIGAALAFSPANAIVAVAAGRYDDGDVVLYDEREVWGACAAETILSTSTGLGSARGTVELAGGGAAVRHLAIEAPERLGVLVDAFDVEIEGVVVTGALGVGIAVLSGSASISGAIVRDVRPAADGTLGRGIDVERGALSVARVLVERARGTAVFAGGASASIEAGDLVIVDVLAAEDATLGRGVEARAGARVALARALIERALDDALIASDAGSTLEARDVVVRDTRAEMASGSYGRGVDAEMGARVVIERALVHQSTEVGLFSHGAGTTLEARDVLVLATRARPSDGRRGRGADAGGGSSMTLERVRIVESREMGVFAVDPGTVIRARDVAIEDTGSREVDGELGAGAWAQQGARIELASARIAGAHVAGVASIDRGTITLDGVAVRDVGLSACGADGRCPERAGGFAISAHFGATLTAMRFELGPSEICGIVIGGAHPEGDATSLDATAGVVDRSEIGACIQVDGYDTSRITRDVEYRDVGIPLQTTSYALPDAI